MSARTPSPLMSSHAWWRLAGYTTLLVSGALIAYWKIYTNFQPYDDEGYVLLSIQEFLRFGGLYTHVYSQYGPFPYELWGAIYRVLGSTVTPDNARALIIALWLVTTVLAGLAVERVTRSIVTGLIAAIVAFTTLGGVITNEVMIPDDLTTLLAIAILAASALAASRERLRMLLVGALVGAMLMTKINIGGAVLLATCLAIAASSPSLAPRPAIMWTFAAFGVVLPLAVMNADLSKSWAENLAVIIALSALSVGAAASRRDAPMPADGRTGVPDFIWFVGAVVATVAVLAVIIVALGTSPEGLIHGVIVGPLGQRDAFSLAANLPTVAFDLAVVGVVGAFIARREIGRLVGPLPAGLLRILIGTLILLWGASALPFVPNPDPTALGVALPFVWIAAAPPGIAVEAHQRLTRVLLAAVAVYAAIGIYPVAGSQTGYASVICMPAAAVIVADGVKQLREWATARIPGARPHLIGSVRLIGLGLLAVLGYQLLLQTAVSSGNVYAGSKSPHFAGGTKLRLPATTATAYTNMVNILETRCDQFVTLPGLNSFYVWTRKIPPTGLNVTAWMFLLNREQQQKTVDAVLHIHRLCLVENSGMLAFWEEGRTPPDRPLYRFLTTAPGFAPIYSSNGYTITRRIQ